jgi:light-regulated signal transduction histidine kinase (bacteriophytochrome)
MEAIRRDVARMTQLIDDLLAFALVSRCPLEMRRTEMWDVCAPLVDEFRTSHAAHEIVVRPEELGAVLGDAALLRQAVRNLLDNALKFSRGVVAPRIEIGCRESGDERVYFVKDNGVGFDMSYAGKLFGVFERLHHAAEFEGVGVGLAIVKQIIERHGGTVWAESAPGRGATFYFTLPGWRSRAEESSADGEVSG